MKLTVQRPTRICCPGRLTGYPDNMPQGGTASHLSSRTSADRARSVSSVEGRFSKVDLVDPQRGHGPSGCLPPPYGAGDRDAPGEGRRNGADRGVGPVDACGGLMRARMEAGRPAPRPARQVR
jgi:hypothetical protein